VLLLDEPTAGLDPGQIQETREVIREFGTRHAVLLSTHILAEVTLICRRVAILNHGRLLAIDSPAGLQRAVESTHRVTLHVVAPPEALREELLAIHGVSAVRIEAPPDGGALLRAECQVVSPNGVEAAIARAVATGNPVLLADEPTGELDFRTGVQILDLLHEQTHQSQTSVIVVTHNREIARIAHRVIELSSGRVVSDGPPPGGRAELSDLHW